MRTIQQCVTLVQSGQVMPAIHSLKQRISANAKEIETHHLIGVAYILAGDYRLAEKHLTKCLKLSPRHVNAQYDLARLYTEQKKFTKAKSLLLSVLKDRPQWLQAKFALALVAIGLDDKPLALESFSDVVATQPDNFEAWANLGNLHQEMESYLKAKDNYQRALTINQNFEPAALGLAKAMSSLNQHKQLVEEMGTLARNLNSAKLNIQMARAYRLLGDKQQAKYWAKLAIDLNDDSGEGYKLFYDSTKIESVGQLQALEQVLSESKLSDMASSNIHFAMVKGLESCREYSRAVEHLNQANYLRRKHLKYTTADSAKLFGMLKKAYSEERLNKSLNTVNTGLGEGHIFILGMPRSGTSLVEQIISSHSEVYGGGELTLMRNLWKQANASSEAKFNTGLLDKSGEYLEQVGKHYLKDATAMKATESTMTDKMPHNFLMIGMIATLLPKAKIIHCKRHPIANCLSIYKADFRNSHGYSFNQKELAEYHNLYEDLMVHWRTVLPGKFYEVKYEELTANQEPETRKLIEYCDLDWQEACLDFHNNKRAVKTASAYQVRQKIHSKSVDLWKRYGEGLSPLIDNLYIPPEYQG